MKKIILTLLPGLCLATAYGQQGWQHKDLKADSLFGISSAKAHDLLKGRKSKPVLVAVIDSGVDTAHVDLRGILWQNPGEQFNGRDDDKNGHIDDLYGWNFLGGAKGSIQYEKTELTRLIQEGQRRFSDPEHLPADTNGLALYMSRRKQWVAEKTKASRQLAGITGISMVLDTIIRIIGKSSPSREDFIAFEPTSMQQSYVRSTLVRGSKNYPDVSSYLEKEVYGPMRHTKAEVDYTLNPDYSPRAIVGDDSLNLKESGYGNADAMGPDAMHGTHVAGIIAAIRNNNEGLDGVADNVRIMSVRAIPQGDERDKDVANAIRYAVDNGAQVINMSFGKHYSPYKAIVDEAVKYAMRKDVLIVHAAGNDALDLDSEENYPNRVYADGSGSAKAWLEVGASGPKPGRDLPAGFSNYGHHTVDVFAPGVGIWSTVPGNKYADMDGTSMAAPVVTGIAALIRSYFPKLTAVEVKNIIMEATVKYDGIVSYRRKGVPQKAPFSQLSISGGVVNAAKAIELAVERSKSSRNR